MSLAPHPSITQVTYRVCGAPGHVRFRTDAAADAFRLYPDPPRRGPTATITADGRTWTAGESSPTGDLSQELTIDGRLRDEQPALWARTAGPPSLWIDETGYDRTQLERILGRLTDSTPDADARTHHQFGALHLHLPAPAVFEGFLLSGPDELYGARFTRKSQWEQTQPTHDFAGTKFWWTAYRQGTNDHTGEPTIPAWHGEAAIGSLVLEIHAQGDAATEARFLAYAKVAIEAALLDPDAPCRLRSGHMGT